MIDPLYLMRMIKTNQLKKTTTATIFQEVDTYKQCIKIDRSVAKYGLIDEWK